MATGTVSSIDTPNWQLLSTVTPTSGQSTMSFTDLSGYNSYKIVFRNQGHSANCYGYIQFNNDTSANYMYTGYGNNNSYGNVLYPVGGAETDRIYLYGNWGGNTFWGSTDITNANQSVIPVKVSSDIASNSYYSRIDGQWSKSTPEVITRMDLTWTSNFNGGGTVKLYGLV